MLTKKYYDGFTVHDILNKHLDDGHKILELLTAFADAHGVDAVPVVRCKECRHLVRYSGALVCSEPNGMMTFSPDGFCSYGQRREEERRDNDHTR